MEFKKSKLFVAIATTTLAFSAMTIAPEAMAHKGKAHHKHAKKAKVVESYETRSSSYTTRSSNSKVDALEAQLAALQSEVSSLRAASNRPHFDPDTAKVQELDQWMQSTKHEHKKSHGKDNMVFFRGGYGRNNEHRGGTLDPTGAAGALGGVLPGAIGDRDAWYAGAGFDFSLNDNLFGLMNNTEVLAELMFDYKQLGERKLNGLNPALTGAVLPEVNTAVGLPQGTIGVNNQTATVNAFTLAASPKIKFMKGSAFRPWLIPAGLEMTVISPPSDAITVLNPGMMFGAGADYKIWNDLYAGADVRYHHSFDNVDGVNPDGLTAGGYLGIGF